MIYPYAGVPEAEWHDRTLELIHQHPIAPADLVRVTLAAWACVLDSKICSFQIGTQFFPTPQMMGNFLDLLIPELLHEKYPTFRRGVGRNERDVHCDTDAELSIEIKASSHKGQVFGNRSYGQPPADPSKERHGYFLAVNFERFRDAQGRQPDITSIRFGWLDHAAEYSDWVPQKSQTGQQASLKPATYRSKLLRLYPGPALPTAD